MRFRGKVDNGISSLFNVLESGHFNFSRDRPRGAYLIDDRQQHVPKEFWVCFDFFWNGYHMNNLWSAGDALIHSLMIMNLDQSALLFME